MKCHGEGRACPEPGSDPLYARSVEVESRPRPRRRVRASAAASSPRVFRRADVRLHRYLCKTKTAEGFRMLEPEARCIEDDQRDPSLRDVTPPDALRVESRFRISEPGSGRGTATPRRRAGASDRLFAGGEGVPAGPARPVRESVAGRVDARRRPVEADGRPTGPHRIPRSGRDAVLRAVYRARDALPSFGSVETNY